MVSSFLRKVNLKKKNHRKKFQWHSSSLISYIRTKTDIEHWFFHRSATLIQRVSFVSISVWDKVGAVSMDGWTDGRMGGWVDGWIYGWWVHGWVGEWMGGWMDGWVNGWVDEWMGGWMDGWMNGWVGEWMGGWMDGWVNGWVGGWMDGWIWKIFNTS